MSGLLSVRCCSRGSPRDQLSVEGRKGQVTSVTGFRLRTVDVGQTLAGTRRQHLDNHPSLGIRLGCRVAFLPTGTKSASCSLQLFAQLPRPSVPVSTLQATFRKSPARLEARMDSLLLSCRALSSRTTCRFPALSELPTHWSWRGRRLASAAT